MPYYAVLVNTKERWEYVVEAKNEDEAEAVATKRMKDGDKEGASLRSRRIDFIEAPIKEVR